MFTNQLWKMNRVLPMVLLLVYLVLFLIVYWRRKHEFTRHRKHGLTFNLHHRNKSTHAYVLGRYISNAVLFLSSIALLFASLGISKVAQQVNVSAEDTYVLFVVDISPSMAAADFDQNTRIMAFQKEFNGLLNNVKNKKIGVILFSEFISMLVPFTDDYEYITRTINDIQLGTLGLETALIDALAYAYSIYRSIPSHRKVMVVVTDGNQNSGTTEFNTMEDFLSTTSHLTILLHMGSDAPVPFSFRDPYTNAIISGTLQPALHTTLESFSTQSRIDYHYVQNIHQLRRQLTRILYDQSEGVSLGVDTIRVSYTDFFLIFSLVCFLLFLFIRHGILRVLW